MKHPTFDWTKFGGATYSPKRDGARLSRALQTVCETMKDGHWHTLPELANKAGCSVQGASARVRDLRKDRFGAHTVDREYVGGGSWRYRMVV